MLRSTSPPARPAVAVHVHTGRSLAERLPALARFAMAGRPAPLSRHPAWLPILRDGLGHDIYALEARAASGEPCGFLPLAFVGSLLFGRFLVSLPYLNSNGVIADAPEVAAALVSRAVELTDELNAKHLELRHETPIAHPALNARMTTKVHMRLPLPETVEQLWKGFDAKVRNQVRKGEKSGLTVAWGGEELLPSFYAVLCHNMRDLGTPVYGLSLFRGILRTFPGDAELCVVRAGETPVSAALLQHGPGVTEVPTASSLREYNSTCANMLMYRCLIERAVLRRQVTFDFGRSTAEGPTFRFKRQWGAVPQPATWQYHLRTAELGEMRPENPRYQRMIRLWQRLPVRLTRYLGPVIVRGIP